MERYEYEEKYYQAGYDYIIGLDEAGRGPMAGELVVAGVVFPKGFYDERINDSKQLSAKKREVLYDLIIENALYYDIEIISVADVDRLNVYQASKQGMEKCLELLKKEKMFALTDAMPIDYPDHLSIIKGDAKSISIAGASILAKVTRDRLCGPAPFRPQRASLCLRSGSSRPRPAFRSGCGSSAAASRCPRCRAQIPLPQRWYPA